MLSRQNIIPGTTKFIKIFVSSTIMGYVSIRIINLLSKTENAQVSKLKYYLSLGCLFTYIPYYLNYTSQLLSESTQTHKYDVNFISRSDTPIFITSSENELNTDIVQEFDH